MGADSDAAVLRGSELAMQSDIPFAGYGLELDFVQDNAIEHGMIRFLVAGYGIAEALQQAANEPPSLFAQAWVLHDADLPERNHAFVDQ